ncbi:TPA: 50S ribosomal protein L21e [Candidatus Woesearchaeota archaeon]|nr:LSU ribosomal protein L21E [archaeon GW2011_AR15]MBS3104005.1 50S ribosomal protein L21e [Candidatus Woesearchaeota archaeon]HIH40928.1 50S ribosomal protein L21e [Candidatus Woesearchaeota archaeon]
MQHHGSFRRKTRGKLSKGHKEKGKISLRKFFQEFKNGEKVVMKAEPAYQNGMYYPRFHGKSGMVLGKRGECYEVLIKDGRKEKLLIVHPIHLKRSEK